MITQIEYCLLMRFHERAEEKRQKSFLFFFFSEEQFQYFPFLCLLRSYRPTRIINKFFFHPHKKKLWVGKLCNLKSALVMAWKKRKLNFLIFLFDYEIDNKGEKLMGWKIFFSDWWGKFPPIFKIKNRNN